jgi:hypothetical protein
LVLVLPAPWAEERAGIKKRKKIAIQMGGVEEDLN